jgi:hypothetical protein
MPNYRVEYHRVWVKTVEAENRKQALEIVEAEMSEESNAEDYNYPVVKRPAQVCAASSVPADRTVVG